jgi:hypothetical protein
MPLLDDDRLVFRFPEIDEDASFEIDFQRTLRIPDTDRDYPLPPGFGRFPLEHVEDHPALPEHTRRRGGVLLPMWQAEAMWLNFNHRGEKLPVAVKVAAGKINAVTGEPWTTPLNRDPQDYVVCPEQPWLDGFAVEPGVIRQFVAMPLGVGYSAEEQLTGQAEWGGLQISVTPMKQDVWERMKRPQFQADAASLSEVCMSYACEEMGLGAGGRMRQRIEADVHKLDHWDQRATQRVFVTFWHASYWQPLTGRPAPTHPPLARDYAAAGLPWFEHYGRGGEAATGSDRLRGLRSVASVYSDKEGVPLPGSEDVAVSDFLRFGPAAKTPRPVKSMPE